MSDVSVNGIHQAITELSGRMPVYAMVGSRDLFLECRAGKKQWQLKSTSTKAQMVVQHDVLSLPCVYRRSFFQVSSN